MLTLTLESLASQEKLGSQRINQEVRKEFHIRMLSVVLGLCHPYMP